jgi:methyl-accepting chemotaxis protein
MSIKIKILIVTILGFVVSLVGLSIYNNSSSYNNSFELIKKEAILVNHIESKIINDYFSTKIKAIDTLSKNILNNKDTISENLSIIKNSLGMTSVYVGFENNGLMVRYSGRNTLPKDGYDPRIRPWYTLAKSNNKLSITDVYVDSSTKNLTITISAPVMENGNLVGIVGGDLFLNDISKFILGIELPFNGYAYLLDENKKVVIHKDQDLYSKLIDLKFKDEFLETENELLSISKIKNLNWSLVIAFDKKLAFESINETFIANVILSLVFTIIIILIIYFVLNKILSPIEDVKNGLEDFFAYLKHEKSSATRLNINTNDELGIMAKDINTEIETIERNLEKEKEFIEEVTLVSKNLAYGDLSHRITKNTKNVELNQLKDIINNMIDSLNYNLDRVLNVLKEFEEDDFRKRIKSSGKTRGIIKRLFDGVDSLGDSLSDLTAQNLENGLKLNKDSDKLNNSLSDVVNSMSEQTVFLQNVTKSLEELNLQIGQNTNKAVSMKELSQKVRESIHNSHILANNTYTSMNNIYDATSIIRDSIVQIDEISFQTNILSLNAAVEAATAGEAGKSFAVVAAEVRSLANRSAEVAKQIQDIVQDAQDKSTEGKNIAENMQNDYEALNTQVKDTIVLIDDVANSSQEQLAYINDINNKIEQLNSSNEQNVSIIHTTEEIAEQTKEMSFMLVEDSKNKEFSNKESILSKS